MPAPVATPDPSSPTTTPQPPQGQSDPNVVYEGPIPENLRAQLIAAGADPDLLYAGTLHVYVQAPLTVLCGENAAITPGTNVNICQQKYFNAQVPNEYLVHELVHVRQYLQDPAYGVKYVGEMIKDKLGSGNRYEVEAYGCMGMVRQSLAAGSGVPVLDNATCNLTLGR